MVAFRVRGSGTFIFFSALLALCVPATGKAATIRVPADVSTIQQALNAAASGDTVLVSPGTYLENINFLGKAVTVVSEQGPQTTIIHSPGIGSVVSFVSGETRGAVLDGFTIRNGRNNFFGGGIFIRNSSPTIRGNTVTANGACTGAGIYSSFGSPLIERNKISGNFVFGCTGSSGIGVFIGGNSAAELIDNDISDNNGPGHGGGVSLFAAGSPVLRGNIIRRNAVSGFIPCSQGGGIYIVNFAQAVIVNNLIVGNTSGCGGGLYWQGSTGSTVLVNNTFADNDAAQGSAVFATGVDARNQLHNNIIQAKTGQTALLCQLFGSFAPAVLNSNNVFSSQGSAYGGTCADQTGSNGNISADSRFIAPPAGDYRVQMTSPVIDAGSASAPHIPAADLVGHARVLDGNGDGVAVIDMGAFEYDNRAPVADAGPDQTLTAGPGCFATVALNGQGSDPDGDQLTFLWSGAFGTASGSSASVSLLPGRHVVTLTVNDGNGGTASDTVVVTVLDTQPPTIGTAAASPDVLLQANHQMVPVTVTVSVTDCDPGASCRIDSVTSNEPVDGLGDGDTTPDWTITGNLTLSVRAERSAHGDGRVYTIIVRCTDASGNSSTRTVSVTVPRTS